MKRFLAFDVGGTTIKYGVVAEDRSITHRGVVSTDHNADGAILKQLLRVTRALQTKLALAGVGVSTAGIVGADGAIQYAGPTIPNYQGTPLKATLAEVSGKPTHVVNDVAAALLSEQIAGAAQGIASVYCVALGTGIGGAYYHNGELLQGTHGTANSLGYLLYDGASKTTYEQRAATLRLQAQLQPQGISVIEAFARAKAGDAAMMAVLQSWAATVASGLAPIVLLLDPAVLVLGGAVSQQGQYLLDLIAPELDRLLPEGLRQTQLRVAALGNDAQLIGAVTPFLKK